MNRNDFRNPLIQSGIVLLVVFILIAIVTNAGPNGIIGSIAALVTGIFNGVLFVIALLIGILFSIAILIGIYIAAVSFQSSERGREVFDQVVDSVKSFYAKLTGTVASKRARRAEKKQAVAGAEATATATATNQTASTPAAAVQSDEIKEVWKNLDALRVFIQELQTTQSTATEELASIKQSLHNHEEDSVAEKLDELTGTQQSLAEKLAELTNRIDSDTGRLTDLENSYANTCEKLKEEISELHKKTSVPEIVSGILSYIDKTEDRDLVTEKAEEAISRGMTYNQIDEFFKSSLDNKVYKVLAEHPRLTKDFLRSIKKKFG